MDRFAARFSGAIRMQGHRVEIISELEVLAERMLKQFFRSTGGRYQSNMDHPPHANWTPARVDNAGVNISHACFFVARLASFRA
eukprot:COSAG05_NODE_2934_length_2489_cov_2.459414_3_plen_84_part_00